VHREGCLREIRDQLSINERVQISKVYYRENEVYMSSDHYSTEGKDENDVSELFTIVVHMSSKQTDTQQLCYCTVQFFSYYYLLNKKNTFFKSPY